MAQNRYEILKNTPNLKLLISIGAMPMEIFDWLIYYEAFREENKKLKRMQSYSNVAENYKLSEQHIGNVVRWMESK